MLLKTLPRDIIIIQLFSVFCCIYQRYCLSLPRFINIPIRIHYLLSLFSFYCHSFFSKKIYQKFFIFKRLSRSPLGHCKVIIDTCPRVENTIMAQRFWGNLSHQTAMGTRVFISLFSFAYFIYSFFFFVSNKFSCALIRKIDARCLFCSSSGQRQDVFDLTVNAVVFTQLN